MTLTIRAKRDVEREQAKRANTRSFLIIRRALCMFCIPRNLEPIIII